MRRGRSTLIAVIATCINSASANAGTIITDGSLGRATTINGPNYVITANLGQTRGGNLFQSFKQLDLSAGDVATFSGPSMIKNVITRVTGGTASNIDGTLNCAIPHADFFFINPAGVVFGPSAALDVTGSFTVTTADEIKLADGHAFSINSPANASLTSAAPAAFGFTANHPAAIKMNGSLLRVPKNKAITVAAGPVTLSRGAVLRASGGTVNLLSLDSSATAPLPLGEAPLIGASALLDDITMSGGSELLTSGAGGGRIAMAARDLTMNDSGLDATTKGTLAGRGIDLDLSETLSKADSFIYANTSGSGAGGNIHIAAASINANGAGAGDTGIEAQVHDAATGRGGSISIKAGTIAMSGGEGISVTSFAAGNGGNVSVVANQMTIDGAGDVANSTGVFARSHESGRAGAVRVHASDLKLMNNGLIDGSSFGPAAGGAVSVDANKLSLTAGGDVQSDAYAAGVAGPVSVRTGQFIADGRGSGGDTGVESITEVGSTGSAGMVSMRARSASIVAGGDISSATNGTGNAGATSVSARSLKIDGHGSQTFTGIASQANSASTGAAGMTSVTAKTLSVLGGGAIVGGTHSVGKGGDVVVHAGQLTIDGRSTNGLLTEISSGASVGSEGSAGAVNVVADSASVIAGGQITSSTSSPGRAGNVTVSVRQLKIDGRGDSSFTGIASESNDFGDGAAGSVSVHAGVMNLVGGGEVSTDTNGNADAGTVKVVVDTLTLDGRASDSATTIASSSESSGTGSAGDVSIHAHSASIVAGAFIESDTFGSGHAGNISVVTDALKLDGRGSDGPTYISSDADAGSGSAGRVRIHATAMSVRDSASVSSDSGTASFGNAGDLSITAKHLVVHGTDEYDDYSYISSEAEGINSGTGGNLAIRGQSVTVGKGAEIDTDTNGSRHAGDITVDAADIAVLGNDPDKDDGYISSDADSGSGNAGKISLQAKTVAITGGALVQSDTYSSGRGGDVTVDASALRVAGTDSQGNYSLLAANAKTGSSGDAGKVVVNSNSVVIANDGEISSATNGTGNAGSVLITAKSATVQTEGDISDNTAGPGRAGDINLDVQRLTITGRGTDFFTGIDSTAVAGSSGNAGLVQVHSNSIDVVAGGEIQSDTFASGDAGQIHLFTGDLDVDGSGNSSFTGVSSGSDNGTSGAAGSIVIHASSTRVVAGGDIESNTRGSGRGGDVTVISKNLLVSNSGNSDGGIGARSYESGNAGAVKIHAGAAKISSGGFISSTSYGDGSGGGLSIRATDLSIDGNGVSQTVTGVFSAANGSGPAGRVDLSVADDLKLDDSTIDTAAVNNTGGNVIVGAERLQLKSSSITTAAARFGGNIQLSAPSISLTDKSHITANSNGTSVGDNGGNIKIGKTVLSFSPGLQKGAVSANAGRTGEGNGGKITVAAGGEVIAPFGIEAARYFTATGKVHGTIDLRSPQIDLINEVAPLVAALTTNELSLAPACSMQVAPNQSSFSVEGGNGLPQVPDELQPAITSSKK